MSDSVLKKVYENRKKVSELTKEYKELKKELESILDSSGIDTLTDKQNNLIAVRKKSTRDTLQKSEIPESIWEQYKKITTISTLTVKKDDTHA